MPPWWTTWAAANYKAGKVAYREGRGTGLHFQDISHLLDVLQKLVDKGNSVLVIEHNMDVIKSADYVVDLGPEGGAKGGQIIAQGTPEQVAKNEKSYTGKFLKAELQ